MLDDLDDKDRSDSHNSRGILSANKTSLMAKRQKFGLSAKKMNEVVQGPSQRNNSHASRDDLGHVLSPVAIDDSPREHTYIDVPVHLPTGQSSHNDK